MQVLDTPEPLRNLADLVAAQLEYHRQAYEILSELAPVIDGLQVEQEVSVGFWIESSAGRIHIDKSENRQITARAERELRLGLSIFNNANSIFSF